MIHPKTEIRFINPIIGYGVVATELIPAGTITWVQDKLDQEFTPFEFERFEPVYQNILETYSFRNNKGNLVLCWDHSRFVNHSFRSNCLSTAYDFEIAIRDIYPGEQLTDDYGYLNVTEPFEAMDEGTDRKTVYPDDLLNYHAEWDEKLLSVFHLIPTLRQPLQRLIPENRWNTVREVAAGRRKMDSILVNHYAGEKVK